MLKPIPCPRCGMMPEIDTGFSDAPYPPGQEYVSCPGVRVGIPGVVDQSCGTFAIGVAAWNYRAIPAADARPVQDDAASRRRKLLGYMDDKSAADARAEALKEAAALFNNWWVCAPDGSNITEDVQAAILALISETKP